MGFPRIRRPLRGRPRQAEQPSKRRLFFPELLGRLVVLGMLGVAPWLFGAVQSGVQLWLFAGVLIALACCLIKQLGRAAMSNRLSLAVVPLVGAIVLGVVQLVPLDASTIAALSPAGAELRSSLLPTPRRACPLLAEVATLLKQRGMSHDAREQAVHSLQPNQRKSRLSVTCWTASHAYSWT